MRRHPEDELSNLFQARVTAILRILGSRVAATVREALDEELVMLCAPQS